MIRDNLTNIKLLYTFKDLNSLKIQESIKDLCNNKSGIYLIKNKITNKCYVGRGACLSKNSNRIYNRFRNHFFHNDNSNTYLKKAIKKHGIKNFNFSILEFCDSLEVSKREIFYINKIAPSYNIILVETGVVIGYRHSEEIKKKMRINFSQERKNFIAHLNKRKNLSDKTKEKLKKAALNRSSETKKIIKKASAKFNKLKFGKCIEIYNVLNNQYITTCSSIKDASKYTNVHYRTLKRYFQKKDHHFIKVTDEFKSIFNYLENKAFFKKKKINFSFSLIVLICL